MKNTDALMNKVALPILGIAAVLLVLVIILAIRGATNENNGYIRVINCIISVPATERTQDDIERCYLTVEKETGVTLQRYDTSAYHN